jgi:Fe2+ transport system protein FeoA
VKLTRDDFVDVSLVELAVGRRVRLTEILYEKGIKSKLMAMKFTTQDSLYQ